LQLYVDSAVVERSTTGNKKRSKRRSSKDPHSAGSRDRTRGGDKNLPSPPPVEDPLSESLPPAPPSPPRSGGGILVGGGGGGSDVEIIDETAANRKSSNAEKRGSAKSLQKFQVKNPLYNEEWIKA
jgi:hypothetical protein